MGYDKRGIDVTTEGQTGGRRRDNGSKPAAANVELQCSSSSWMA